MATSILTERGRQGTRVIGATAFNCRTGEFYVFKAKATIDAMSCRLRNWGFSTELTGLDGWKPNITGDGPAMLWRAGAELTYMEKSRPGPAPGYEYPAYGTGNWLNTWHAATIVDARGKEVPWVDANGAIVQNVGDRSRPAPGQKFLGERAATHPAFGRPKPIPDLRERIAKGEFTLPLYADLACMPWYERKAIWGLMVGEEGRTKVPVKLNYEASGFDPARAMLQSYFTLGAESYASQDPASNSASFRMGVMGNSGETIHDWDMLTTLDGLYVAGDATFAGCYWYHAAVTGRYAGRKAADYASKQASPDIDRKQVESEKARVYGPTRRQSGKDWIDWKELRAAGARAMQNYCGGLRNEGLMTTGLEVGDGSSGGSLSGSLREQSPHPAPGSSKPTTSSPATRSYSRPVSPARRAARPSAISDRITPKSTRPSGTSGSPTSRWTGGC